MSCLQVKLTDEVSESLFKIDEIEMTVDFTDEPITNRRFVFNNGGLANIPMRIVGDGYFTDSTGSENLGKSISATPNTSVYMSEGKYKVFVGDKYRLTEIIMTNIRYNHLFINEETLKSLPKLFQLWSWTTGGYGFDGKLNIDEIDMSFVKNFNTSATSSTPCVKGSLKSFTSNEMTRIAAGWQNLDGELKDLQHVPTLTYIDLTRCDVSGNVSGLGVLVALTTLNLSNLPDVTGNIEDMLDAMVTNGRVAGTLSVNGTTSGIKYNGSSFTTKSFTFSSQGWSENA
jgi:hypothetical protein